MKYLSLSMDEYEVFSFSCVADLSISVWVGDVVFAIVALLRLSRPFQYFVDAVSEGLINRLSINGERMRVFRGESCDMALVESV